MTALSILRALPGDIESGRPWEVLLSNDASHGQAGRGSCEKRQTNSIVADKTSYTD